MLSRPNSSGCRRRRPPNTPPASRPNLSSDNHGATRCTRGAGRPGTCSTADDVETRTSRSTRCGERTASCWATTPPSETPSTCARATPTASSTAAAKDAWPQLADGYGRHFRAADPGRVERDRPEAVEVRQQRVPRPDVAPDAHDEQQRRPFPADLDPRAQPVDHQPIGTRHAHLRRVAAARVEKPAVSRRSGSCGGFPFLEGTPCFLRAALLLTHHFPRGADICVADVRNELGVRRRDVRDPVQLRRVRGALLELEQAAQRLLVGVEGGVPGRLGRLDELFGELADPLGGLLAANAEACSVPGAVMVLSPSQVRT